MQQDTVQNKKSIRVPDLPFEIHRDQSQNITYCSSNPPPFLSTTDRLVSVKNNSDPNHLRSSLYSSPSSEFTLQSCAIPFSIIATPFNEKGCLEFTGGADACPSCRSYFNTFSRSENNGFICTICDKKCESHLNYPENLKLSSFEVILSSAGQGAKPQFLWQEDRLIDLEYPPIRNLMTPLFAFMFDMSSPLIYAMIESIVEIIKNENFQTLYQHIGFFVINNGVTTFGLQNGNPVKFKMPGNLPFISQKCVIPTANLDAVAQILSEIKKINEKMPPTAETLINTIKHVLSNYKLLLI